MQPSESRERLSHGIYETLEPGNPIALSNSAEAQQLRDYDRKVMDLVNVDDFTTEELTAGAQTAADATPLRHIA